MHNTCSLFVFNPFSFLINYILVIQIFEMNIDYDRKLLFTNNIANQCIHINKLGKFLVL